MVYVMSDIHGQMEMFLGMLKQIKFSDNDTLYILGDVIDRGEKSIELLQYVIKQKNIIMLMGNHERMMFDYLKTNSRRDFLSWCNNGGDITNADFIKLSVEEQDKIKQFLERLPYYKKITVNDKKFFLCHAGFNKYGDNLEKNIELNILEQDFLWSRHYSDSIDGYCIIHGHTPTIIMCNEYKVCRYNDNTVFNIDCGCAYVPDGQGRLSCLRLDDMNIFYV